MRSLLSITLFLAMSACATTYGPLGHEAVYGGYTDSQIGSNKYIVSFHGNNMTSQDTTRSFAYQRVREVCTQKKRNDFNILTIETRHTGSVVIVDITFSCTGSEEP